MSAECLAVVIAGALVLQARAMDPALPDQYGIGAVVGQADSVSPIVIRDCTPAGPAA